MSEAIKNWSITVLCLSLVTVLWLASSPTRLGYWEAQRDIAYDRIWGEYITDCDCAESLD